MEHLLAPTGASQRIDVPYVATEEFEAADLGGAPPLENFKGYLYRKKWELNPNTGDLIFGDRSEDEIASFLQTAFYFGCLISVFRMVNINVRTRDFLERDPISGGMFVRTTKLLDLINEWIRRERGENVAGYWGFRTILGWVNSKTSEETKRLRSEGIKEILNFTYWFLQFFCRKSQDMPAHHKFKMNLIELSIMAIGESLCSAMGVIYGYQAWEVPTWGPSPVLKARLRNSGWCPSDAPFFPESMTTAAISAHYYFGSRQCPLPRGDHSTCTAAICNAYLAVVDPKDYIQKHVFPGCQCVPVKMPVEADDYVSCNSIPVVTWDGEKLSVSMGSSQNPFVAISHVWVDGLGNNDSNALPACQLSRIQSLVNKLYSEPHRSSLSGISPYTIRQGEKMPFWMDTLCVPVSDDKLRKAAIRQMANIYRQADRALVLDSYLLSLSRLTDLVDKYVGIHLSTWHHRLWTLQEGQLTQNLFFQLKDGAESFYDMNYVELQGFNPMDPANLCSPVRVLCATQLESFYRSLQERLGMSDITTRIRSCAKYLRSRQTSRLEDETLCLSTILELDPGPLFSHKDPVERMAKFYDLVGRFDPRIIFHEHPRLPQDGYRWAPRSFLHQVPDLIPMREDGTGNLPAVSLIPGGDGLCVRFGGFQIGGAGTRLWEPGNPPIFFRPWTAGNLVPLQQWSSSNKTAWYSCTYKIEVLPEPDGPGPDLSELSQTFAVVLPHFFTPDVLPTTAVMGIVDANTSANPVAGMGTVWTEGSGRPGNQFPAYLVPWKISIRYLCRVRISMPPTEAIPQGLPFPTTIAFNTAQEWCIR